MGVNPFKCALGGLNGVMPKTPETPANIPTLVPRAPGKRLQTIGKRHRYQILKLCLRKQNPLAGQAVLNFNSIAAKLRPTVVPTTMPKMIPDAKSENQWTVMETLRPT